MKHKNSYLIVGVFFICGTIGSALTSATSWLLNGIIA